jgi:hypothetical protein
MVSGERNIKARCDVGPGLPPTRLILDEHTIITERWGKDERNPSKISWPRGAYKSVKFFLLKDINHEVRIFRKLIRKMSLIFTTHRGGEEQGEQVAATAAAGRAGKRWAAAGAESTSQTAVSKKRKGVAARSPLKGGRSTCTAAYVSGDKIIRLPRESNSNSRPQRPEGAGSKGS